MTTGILTIEMFSDKIGQDFIIEQADAPSIGLTLTEVKPLRNFTNNPRVPFALLFKSSGNAVLPQCMYPLSHAAIGLHSIFLVSIGRDADSVSYEAVFN